MTGREIRVPSLGDVPEMDDKSLRDLLEAIVQTLDIREGRVAAGTNSRFVTIRDLIEAGVIAEGDIE